MKILDSENFYYVQMKFKYSAQLGPQQNVNSFVIVL